MTRDQATTEGRRLRAGMRVLLVEDSAGDAVLVRNALERALPGVELDISTTVADALGRVTDEQHAFALLLLDHRLPDGTGLELFGRLREAGCRAPAVLMTGAGQEGLAVEALRAGFEHYVVKDLAGVHLELLPLVLEEVLTRVDDRRARRLAEESLREAEARLRLTSQASRDLDWEWDLAAGTIRLPQRWSDLLGLVGDERPGTSPASWFDRVHVADRQRLQAEIDALVRGDVGALDLEHRVRAADGSWRWFGVRAACLRDLEDRPRQLVGSFTDVTSRHVLEGFLLRESYEEAGPDRLTRAELLASLSAELERSAEPPVTVLAIRLEPASREEGEGPTTAELLSEASRRILAALPGAARIGQAGESELLAVLSAADPEAAVAELHERLAVAWSFGARALDVNVRLGAVQPIAGAWADPERVLVAAEERAEAADAGALPLVARIEAPRPAAFTRDAVERALDTGELSVALQPAWWLADGRLHHVEALVRWRMPSGEWASPPALLAMAESEGLAARLDRVVRRRALRHVGRLPPEVRPLVSFNVSPSDFADPAFLERLNGDLKEGGLEPGGVRLELTDAALVQGDISVSHQTSLLRGLGVRLALQGVPSPVTPLDVLSRLNVEAVKLPPRVLPRTSGADGGFRRLAALARLVAAAGLRPEIVGIERLPQLALLRSVGFEVGQGRLLGPELPLEELDAERLRRGPSVPVDGQSAGRNGSPDA